jgi:hypothetical protein
MPAQGYLENKHFNSNNLDANDGERTIVIYIYISFGYLESKANSMN